MPAFRLNFWGLLHLYIGKTFQQFRNCKSCTALDIDSKKVCACPFTITVSIWQAFITLESVKYDHTFCKFLILLSRRSYWQQVLRLLRFSTSSMPVSLHALFLYIGHNTISHDRRVLLFFFSQEPVYEEKENIEREREQTNPIVSGKRWGEWGILAGNKKISPSRMWMSLKKPPITTFNTISPLIWWKYSSPLKDWEDVKNMYLLWLKKKMWFKRRTRRTEEDKQLNSCWYGSLIFCLVLQQWR